MSHYWSHEEDEAYRKGKRDAEYGRKDHFRDKYAWDGPDRAYFDGQKEYERQEENRREEREQDEREERRQQERREYDRQMRQQEEDYYRQQEEDAYYNQQQKPQMPESEPDDLPY